MNVAELIALLKKLPADKEVVVQSYEEGFDPVTALKVVAVSETPDRPWYIGVYVENAQGSKTMVSIQSQYNRADGRDA